jgi:hypothetical protein
MTSAIASPRYILAVVIVAAAVACRPAGTPVAVVVVDLVRQFDRAEKRPPAAFDIADRTVHGVSRPSLVVPVPSRATWSLPLPRRGVFRAFLALDAGDPATAVRLRIGVSDHRIYEGLADWVITGRDGWTEVHADLSAYAGFHWSLFYRPDGITWRVVLGADPVEGGPALALWGAPEIATDRRAALEYVARRHDMR